MSKIKIIIETENGEKTEQAFEDAMLIGITDYKPVPGDPRQDARIANSFIRMHASSRDSVILMLTMLLTHIEKTDHAALLKATELMTENKNIEKLMSMASGVGIKIK